MSAPQPTARHTVSNGSSDMLILDCLIHVMSAGQIWHSRSSQAFTLVVATGSLHCHLPVQSLAAHLNERALVLVAPDTALHIEAEQDCRIGIIHFCLFPYDHHQSLTKTYTAHPYIGSLLAGKWRPLLADLDHLSRLPASVSGTDHVQYQQSLRDVLQHILLPASSGTLQNDSRTLVDRSIAYIHQAYPHISSVDELARRAHLEKRQYTRIFQQITGQSPLQYLTAYRMNRAKEHLLLEGSQVAQIAEKCGYQDEYYFIRRFKEVVGDSPRRYARSRRRVERVYAMQFVGELLALGIRPCARSADLATLPFGESPDSLPLISPHAEEAALQALAPDLIVASDFVSPGRIDRLSLIAPVLVLAWDRSPREHLQHLADALGREHEASAWLAHYDQLRQEVESLSEAGQHNLRAAVIGVEHGDIWLMAPRFFPVFHETLGYRPVPHMLLNLAHNPQTRLVRLGLDELAPLQEADHLFMLYKNQERFKHTLATLTDNPLWHALPAVRERRLTILGERWTCYDMMSHYRQLLQLRDCKAQIPIYG